jgi:hypothetical protein
MAMNWELLKTCYLRSELMTQLENLVLNLTRIQTLTENHDGEEIAKHLIRESQYFIEWTVSNLDLEQNMTLATTLVDLQRQLSGWKLDWSDCWSSPLQRQQLIQQSTQWCDRIAQFYSPLLQAS